MCAESTATRVLKNSPEIYELIRDGKLSLCAIAEVAPVMNVENKEAVLEKAQGASKREAEIIAAEFGAPLKPQPDRIKPRFVARAEEPGASVGHEKLEARFSFSFEVSKEVRALYDEARELLGPCGIAEVFERALKEFVQKRKPKAKRATPPVDRNGRYFRRQVVRDVRERDGGQCTHVSEDGKRCSERCGLQIDHMVPFACGGSSSAENMRLLCPAHNQLQAESWFGKEFINKKRGGRMAQR